MVKISKRQAEEVDFLSKFFSKATEWPTPAEIGEYLSHTVHGSGGGGNNPLTMAKWRLDVQVKMWREDLTSGILSSAELMAGFGGHPHAGRVIGSIIGSISPAYRTGILSKAGFHSPLAISNFPALRDDFARAVASKKCL